MTTVLLPVAALYIVVAIISGTLAALGAAWARGRKAASSSLLWAALIIAPLIVAAIGTVALIAPSPLTACHCLEHGHHPHICLIHPALAAPLLAPALAVVGTWLLAALPRLVSQLSAQARAARLARELRGVPPETVGDTPVRFLDCGSPSAFTAGAVAPMVVVDRSLWRGLSEADREAVLHHERHHVRRADTLTLVVLRFCLALQPWLPRAWIDRWRHAAELECDRHAAERLGDPSAVAEALLTVSKLRVAADDASLLPNDAALGVFDAGGLEERVVALLDSDDRAQPKHRAAAALGLGSASANDVLSLLVPALGVVVLALVWPGDALHHAVETVIGLFSH